jgi:hypothetical protein
LDLSGANRTNIPDKSKIGEELGGRATAPSERPPRDGTV